MKIVKKLINYNFNKGGNSKKYIVVHDTGNTGIGADAENHYKYFNGGDRQSSAHYFIDDKVIMQLVEDNDRSWHCGKKYGNASRSEINNNNSIGVEICVNADGDYSKAYANTVELVKYLMEKYNIKADDVVRHYDACLKTCPNSMSKNNWKLWDEFKKKLVEEKNMFKVGNLTVLNEKEYQKNAIEKAIKQGVFAGDGATFDVSENITKGDLCVILERLGLVK